MCVRLYRDGVAEGGAMPRVVVTGAAGFIGWKTSEKLLERGYEVIGLDNLDGYYPVQLKMWRLNRLRGFKRFKFYELDVENFEALRILFEESGPIDAIINLAARAGVRASVENPWIYFKTNAIGTLNLLELCKDFGVRKFILASSSSVYAGHPMPFKEDLPVNSPISPYAASKKAAEVCCYTYHHLYGVDVSVLRYFTVYGPAGRPDMSVLKFIRRVDEGRPITLYGDGTQRRDFTYIDDIAEGTIRALRPLGYEIINLGGNRPYELKYLIALIERELGKKAIIDYKPFQRTDMRHTWADISKARRLLGWEPKVGLEEGVRRTVKWYLKNRNWLVKLSF